MAKVSAPANIDIPYVPTEVLPPGETIRETLEALEMSQTQLASRTGLSTKHINQVLQGQSALTHDTAIALERATGVSAKFWNSLEANYRDYQSRQKERASLETRIDLLKVMPLAELAKRGVVDATSKAAGAQLQEILQFFGVSTVEAWQDVWAVPSAKFLQSAAFEADAGAVAAWLRLGEIAAAKVQCEPFSRKGLRAVLPELRALTVYEQSEYVPRLTAICAEVGVAVVLEREITGARASGATRWMSPNKAIIQLSGRGKRNDKFWFAFFHEVGHVLLHGKKDVFVENDIGNDGGRMSQEHEANQFARELLIPKQYEPELMDLDEDLEVIAFANRIGIAPGIVAGRVQHERKDYRIYSKLFQKFEPAE